MELFRALGPDLTVFAYVANFRTAEGVNENPVLMNELNAAVYERLSLQTDEEKSPPQRPLFVTASAFDPAVTGPDFVGDIARRCGIKAEAPITMRHLISTTQNPWITATSTGNIIGKLMDALDQAIREATARIVERNGLNPFVPPKRKSRKAN